MQAKVRKYTAVFVVSWRNQWAYAVETAIRGIFLVVIMYVFSELWQTTFQATRHTSMNGYGVKEVLWYLVITEAIIIGSPRLTPRLSEEIKQGDIAYRLTKPIHFIGYHYMQFLGEVCARVIINVLLGGIVVTVLFGLPKVSIPHLGLFVIAFFVAVSTQFFMSLIICLLLFWIEDGKGLELILSRMVMILGGMMIPLPLFPHWLASLSHFLPFQVVAYLPAHVFVVTHQSVEWSSFLMAVLWMTTFIVICNVLYAKGVKQLHVQGG